MKSHLCSWKIIIGILQKSEKDLVDGDDEDRLKKSTRKQLPLPETGVLWHTAQSEKHRHLLKHPVITSFLWLKWQRIRQGPKGTAADMSEILQGVSSGRAPGLR